MITCERCGAGLKIGQRFCEGCGTSVAAATAGDAPVAPAQATPGYPPVPPGQPLVPPPATMAPPVASAAGGPGGPRRARFLVPIAIGVVIAVAVVGFVVLRDGDGDRTRSQVLPNGKYLRLDDGPSGEPEERWNESVDCERTCTLGVGDDTVYVASRSSRGTDLEAFDAGSGQSRWKQRRTTDDSVYSVMVIGDRVLLIGDGVVAVDAADGEQAWKAKESPSGFVHDDVIFLSDYDYDDGGDSRTVAVSLRDGDERWSEDGIVQGVCDGIAYVDEAGKRIVAFDASSGDQRWKRSLGATALACGPDGVFVGDGDDLHRLDPSDGKDKWSKPIDGSPQFVGDGLVLVDDDGACRGIEAADGSRRWRSEDFACALIPVDRGRALGSNEDGDIVLVGVPDAERLDRQAGSSGEEGSISALGSNIYVELDDDQLDAVGYLGSEFTDAWSIDVDRRTATIAVGAGSVFTLTDDELTAYR